MLALVIRVIFVIADLTIVSTVYQDSSSSLVDTSVRSNSVIIGKCCEPNELMLDGRCTLAKEAHHATKLWKPKFTDEQGHPLAVEPEFELRIGLPRCKNNEKQWDIYHVPDTSIDLLMILPSGKLRHCIECDVVDLDKIAEVKGQDNGNNRIYYDYDFGTYCTDEIILSNDETPKFYARVCLPSNQRIMQPDYMMRRVIDPAFRAISIVCYLIVAVVYFVLPQLRNLIGNIITSMTMCLITSQCADMVRIFTEFSNHVSFLVADAITYISLLSAFFWLNILGYYIWKTFRSRNVFLRVTDGRKYCYYSIYVWCSTAGMGAMAIFAHFVLDTNKPTIDNVPYVPQETIGWLGVAVFFTPVAFTILLNLCFRMFVFLFIIMAVSWFFTLLSWMRYELIYCYIVVNLLQAVLILYVCVFGQRRVTFLLRKTCNCCSPNETSQGLDWGEEMTAINVG
ncbi:probable G-protein coupled receptor Mth-like 5 isoform X2 [Athalia rosae]|uniref:probable G-protein coupled receptor Mth-like 5 isoform X2 n=1 Tax=Athalia rosae TaxID=37344 RepID=UPI0020333B3F|nr:probable G-protein coupled receptor Mth-like 5 isoform X2 [Athalia rosae]